MLRNLPIPLGKYKVAFKGYTEDNGTMQRLLDVNVYTDVYEA